MGACYLIFQMVGTLRRAQLVPDDESADRQFVCLTRMVE